LVLKNLMNVFLRTSVFRKTADYFNFYINEIWPKRMSGWKVSLLHTCSFMGAVWSDARGYGIFSQGFEKLS